jgi:hypothetical protein
MAHTAGPLIGAHLASLVHHWQFVGESLINHPVTNLKSGSQSVSRQSARHWHVLSQ